MKPKAAGRMNVRRATLLLVNCLKVLAQANRSWAVAVISNSFQFNLVLSTPGNNSSAKETTGPVPEVSSVITGRVVDLALRNKTCAIQG